MGLCTITIKVGENLFQMNKVDSSIIPSDINEDFMKLLNTDQWEKFIESFSKNLKSGGVNKDLRKSSDYTKGLSNFDAEKLAKIYPNLNWPKADLSKYKILIQDQFGRYGTLTKFNDPNGNEIIVVDNKRDSINKVCRYIRIKETIQNGVLSKLSEDSDEYKLLDKVLTVAKGKYKGIKDLESLVLHFIDNKSSYNSFNVDGVSAYTILNNIIPNIENIYYKRKSDFKSIEVGNFYTFVSFNKGLPQVSTKNFWKFMTLQNYDVQKFFKDETEFFTLMKQIISEGEQSDELKPQMQKVNDFLRSVIGRDPDKSITGLQNFMEYLFKQEPGFPYIYKEINNKNFLIFESTYYQAKKTYGLTFDSILLLNRNTYKNYRIYDDGTNYYVSKWDMIEESYIQKFSSEEEAKKAIDILVNNETFLENFPITIFQNPDKKRFQLNKTFPQGTVINLPSITLSTSIRFNYIPQEAIINGNYKIEDFINKVIPSYPKESQKLLINNGKLVDILNNNIINVGLFVALLCDKHKGDRSPKVIKSVLEDLRGASTKYYYVDKRSKVMVEGKEIRTTRLLPTKDPNRIDKSEKVQKGQRFPAVALWETIASTMDSVFGTTVQVLTQNEIKDKYKNTDHSNHKAFIDGTNIVINSTLASTEDLFHEYFHIIMGYMKSNSELRPKYEQLLQEVWKNTSKREQNKINYLYSELSYTDRLEENFVKKFGEYIANKADNTIKKIFNTSEIEKSVSSIFDADDLNLQKLGNTPVNEVFNRFSSEISKALMNKQSMFSDFAKGEMFKLTSKKTNLLKKWIKDGILIEENCK